MYNVGSLVLLIIMTSFRPPRQETSIDILFLGSYGHNRRLAAGANDSTRSSSIKHLSSWLDRIHRYRASMHLHVSLIDHRSLVHRDFGMYMSGIQSAILRCAFRIKTTPIMISRSNLARSCGSINDASSVSLGSTRLIKGEHVCSGLMREELWEYDSVSVLAHGDWFRQYTSYMLAGL